MSEEVTAHEEPTQEPAAVTEAPAEPDATPDPSAEVEKWKAQARKNEERAKANAAAAKELAELKAAQMTESEKLAAERDAARAEAEAAKAEAAAVKLDALRTSIATEKGLPADLAARLIGGDEDAIRADADKLISALPKPEAPGARPPATESAEDALLRAFLGK